jgi:hypothetical protein
MIVLAREVCLCKCSTAVPSSRDAERDAEADGLRFVSGSERDLGLLDPADHDDARRSEFRARLDRGEYWLLGLVGERVATYTWLHTRSRCEYPYLPGCAFCLPADFGYGYDAWTQPALRGSGLRRAAFVEELRVLSTLGKAWEASFFVHYQLDGARRSLARVCVDVVPLWRVALDRDGGGRRLAAARLARDDAGVRPEFPVTAAAE